MYSSPHRRRSQRPARRRRGSQEVDKAADDPQLGVAERRPEAPADGIRDGRPGPGLHGRRAAVTKERLVRAVALVARPRLAARNRPAVLPRVARVVRNSARGLLAKARRVLRVIRGAILTVAIVSAISADTTVITGAAGVVVTAAERITWILRVRHVTAPHTLLLQGCYGDSPALLNVSRVTKNRH